MTAHLFLSFLHSLQVPCTESYTRARFASMPFPTLFGLAGLMEEYGIDTAAYNLEGHTNLLSRLEAPFMARMRCGFVLVTANGPSGVSFTKDGDKTQTLPSADFAARLDGPVFLAFPRPNATEPHFREHRIEEVLNGAKKWVMVLAAVFAGAYAAVRVGLFDHPWAVVAGAVMCLGLYVSALLFLKSHGFNTSQADRICGVVEAGGCHDVLSTAGAKFFGLFGWAEVGLAYFSVSLGALLLFPSAPYLLAWIAAAVAPFSFWSIWYQKYRAKAWCTMCLIVQGCLWLGLGAWALGGYYAHFEVPILPLTALGATYLAVMLGLNALPSKKI